MLCSIWYGFMEYKRLQVQAVYSLQSRFLLDLAESLGIRLIIPEPSVED